MTSKDDRITGSVVAGKVESAVGDIAGDAKTQASGRAQQIAASRLVTSVASRDLRCVTASLTPRDAVPDRRIAAAHSQQRDELPPFHVSPRGSILLKPSTLPSASEREMARAWHQRVRGSMSELGVRREKAALSSGCEPHPATAPAGSNRSSHGGNEVAEAFD
jgi:hypothetical protein